MTPRESYFALISGRAAEPLRLATDGSGSFAIDEIDPSKVSLKTIFNPVGLARADDVDLVAELAEDPGRGNQVLDGYVSQVAASIMDALADGYDGILYRLSGAHPDVSSPMEYGGYFLERDRELLGSASSAGCNILMVEGGEGVYLDFVSDLPAQVFAWDSKAAGVGPSEIRAVRSGLIACADAGADIEYSPTRFGVMSHV